MQPGDTITFINESSVGRDIRSKNAQWSVSDLADGASATITFEEGWKNDYVSRIKGSGNGGNEQTGETVNNDLLDIEQTNEVLHA